MRRMTDPTPARHVAFDWGGVFTVGTFDGRSTQNLAERSGVDVERVRESYFRHVRQLEVGAWTLPQFWQVMQQETGITLPYADFEALYLGSIRDNLPMYTTLAALPREVRVGLLSNNYPVVCDHLRRDPRFARFDALVFSNEIGQKKPHPDAFAALADAMGVPASQVAFVDDVQENIDAAQAAGFHGLLYHHDHHATFERELGAWLGLPVGASG
ncbi:HAD family phosphatase [Deinococcus metallilatus]|uniref:HAD family phosphatase n=2 Tax=Deinococcus metallilatus TaxID=1211322 RepID=A0AAJ5F834_9DEIO|nr:HAD family phosphatase [Deinococcus metallilatus]RXJ10541.1 HAD family phosphatase [Deinococcus metallilatus]TLK26512.1 HAD family phosphatase [Deinococcus metallilatus]